MVLVGLAGAFWGLLKSASGLPIMLTGLALGAAIIWQSLRIQSTRHFLVFCTTAWIISRGLIVALLPNFILTGDERYFHDFVTKLATVIGTGHTASLSNIYDFPVWLSRSFPFYLPLAAIFKSNDIWAARILNVLLGAAQLTLLFSIAQKFIGARPARLCCILLLLFPYHFINVLSYDPQIAGTFFLLLAVWLFLRLTNISHRRAPQLSRDHVAYRTVTVRERAQPEILITTLCLALSLLLAGIQRGGIDLLLAAVMLTVLLLQKLSQPRRLNTRRITACLIAICLLWLPLRFTFNHWITSQDANVLRSHTLGFMTRGWNLASSGEYLPLYEQLDVAAAKAEKQRTLEAVLITEFARQPIRSLLILTPIKTAKFFALGHASTAEQGLIEAGYSRAASIYQSLSALYAPLILLLCLLGLVRCWRSARLQARLMTPVLLIVLSCLAIVLIWETSPRYSHPIQFALLILATVGLTAFSRSWLALRIQPRLVWEFASSGAAIAVCWLVISGCIVGVARSATNYQFLDPRVISAHIGNKPVEVEPIHSFTQQWESAIRLPAGTALPATVQVSLPAPRVKPWDHVSVSLWLPDLPARNDTPFQVSCTTAKGTVTLPAAASGHIIRVELPRTAKDHGSLTLSLVPNTSQTLTVSPLRIGIGYALTN